MKHFIYTYHETMHPARNGVMRKTVRVYQITSDRAVVFLGDRTDTFVSAHQLVMDFLKDRAALPEAAFALRESGCYIYGSPYALEAANFACITLVT